ncbi:MAG: inositol monophosphatase [Streptosporangiaceae bacterium]
MIDLDAARAVAVAAAEAAGAVITEGVRGPYRIHAKGLDGDVVTDLDHQAEKVIKARLLESYPGHAILAEESGLATGVGDLLWVVDPLDGTNNLAIGLPAYSVGVALCSGGVPLVGVIHDPVRGQTWSAIRDGGARGHGLRTAPTGQDRALVLSWVQGYPVGRQDRTAMAYKLLLGAHCRRLLQLWAPQLTWVMLAQGLIDGIIAYRTGSVDLPAGALLARECGIMFRALDGGPFEVGVTRECEHSFIAARPEMIERLVELIGAADGVVLPVIP